MKKILSLLLTVVMCMCVVAPCADALSARAINIDDSETFYTSYATNTGHPGEALAQYVPDIEAFLDYVIPRIMDFEQTINIYSFKIVYSAESYTAIREFIEYYLVELFHVGSVGISYSGSYIYTLRITYRLTQEQYSSQIHEVDVAAEHLLEGLYSDSIPDVYKLLILHDRLAQHCEYDYENFQNGTVSADSRCIYGSLVQGKAVCSGYSRGYMYLLRQLEIDSYLCSSSQLGHEWNIVYLGGEKYHVDVTWDDPIYDIYGRVKHENFLRSTQGIYETNHNKDDFDSSPVDTTYDRYYWKDIETGYQLINGEIFYYDTQVRKLIKVTDTGFEDVMPIDYTWRAGVHGGNYTKSYVKLASDSNYLYYSTPEKIYRYDPLTSEITAVYSPDLPQNYYIYGLKAEDGYFYLDINDTPAVSDQSRAEHPIVFNYLRNPVGETNRLYYNIGAHCGTSVDAEYIEFAEGEQVDLNVQAYKDGWDFIGWSDDVNGTEPLESFVMGSEETQLFAIFKKDITVTFTDGIADSPHTTVYHGTLFNNDTEVEVELPALRDISGWNTVGWAKGITYTAIEDDVCVVSDDTVYYGLYSRQITVSYEANGGTGAPESTTHTVYYNSSGNNQGIYFFISTDEETNPVREGYSFLGWKINNEGDLISSYTPLYVIDNTVIYAVWNDLPDVTDINVRFLYLDENMNIVQSQEVYTIANGESVTVTTPEIPEVSGWTFRGWARMPNNTVTDDFTVSANTMFRAVYRSDPKVSFNANGGSNAPGSMGGTLNHIAGNELPSVSRRITTSIPVRNGYCFMGWSASPSAQTADYQPYQFIQFSSSLTLYAVWSSTGHTVTYDKTTNGGDADYTSPNPLVRGYEPGEEIDLSYTASKNQWNFAGWSTEPNSSNVLDSLVMGDENIVLYAVYSKLYKVGFYNLDEYRTDDLYIYNNESHRMIPLPQQNALEGWEPIGWANEKTADAQVYNYQVDVYSSTSYYSAYEKDVSISFFADGATNTPRSANGAKRYYSQTDYLPAVITNAAITIPSVSPVKPGYVFIGWSDSSSAEQAKYYIGDTVNTSQDMNLYAVFEQGMFNVYFDAQGGTCSTESKMAIPGIAYGTLPDAEKDGYNFGGWFTQNGTQITESSIFSEPGDITLYARWLEKMNIDPDSGIISDGSFIYFESVQQLRNTDFMTIINNNSVAVEPNENGVVSTGAVVAVKDAQGEVTDSRTIVLLGDVDGDGFIDARDAVIVNCIILNMLPDIPKAESKAADANGDGIADDSDLNLLNRYGCLDYSPPVY